MAQYVRLYELESEFQDKRNNDYFEPWVSLTVESDDRVDYNKTEEEKLFATPLTFMVTGDGVIRFSGYKFGSTSAPSWKPAYSRTIRYRLNGGPETSITSDSGNSAATISVVAGDVVEFFGDNATYNPREILQYTYIYCSSFCGTTCQFSLVGNIFSLVNSSGFPGMDGLSSTDNNNAFGYMFQYCTGLTDARKLILPAKTVDAVGIYEYLFYYCTGLLYPPKLQKTETWGYGATYEGLFSYCSNLQYAPEIPSSIVNENCYANMFRGCRQLTSVTIPEIRPQQTNRDFSAMFYGCSNLSEVRCLLDPSLYTSSDFNLWMSGVASTGTFYKKAGTEWTSGTSGIPNGWTVQDAT